MRRVAPTIGLLAGLLCSQAAPASDPSLAAPIATTDPAHLLADIRSTVVDSGGAVALRGVELEIGPARFVVQQGVLFPTRTIDGRRFELIFVGQARFRVDPPDAIEAGQLELFTGEHTMDAPVEEAVLVVADPSMIQRLLERSPPRDLRPDLVARAEGIHRRWLEETERRHSGVESAIFRAAVGDEPYRHYVTLWCNSFELGEFVFQIDPDDPEPITLASFAPLKVSNWESKRLERRIRIQQRKGRWLGVRLQDLGTWDIWSSSSWSPGGVPLSGDVGFETEHYDLDVTIRRDRMKLSGTAKLHLKVQSGNRRVVPLDVMPDLKVLGVVDDQGRDLFFFPSGEEVVVLLTEPPPAGESLTLEVTYEGRALNWVGKGTFDLNETRGWYPHCGVVDRATYDVTLRWPKKYELVAGGRLVESGRHGRYRWERRRLDLPGIAFSFALGDYAFEREQVGGIQLTVAFSESLRLKNAMRRDVVEAIAEVLRFFEQAFGPYPMKELTVVTVPRSFSQSYLGFVALADSTLGYSGVVGSPANWMRDTTIAHELAHQWWGNLVGWSSYRDQWLSEGMANYAALLFDNHRAGDTNALSVMSSGWRESLTRRTRDGQFVESLGPVVLGSRLNSSKARNGYRPIVYRKGAVVLAMMARAVGQQRFHEMLRSLVDVAANRVMTTETFIKSIEHMSGLDLEGFARQYIYGTGIPEVYYGYDLEQEDGGGWVLTGEARLLSAPRYRHRIVRLGEGRWDVRREPRDGPDIGPTTLVVPFRVILDPTPSGVPDAVDPSAAGKIHQTGRLFLHGRHDEFEITTGTRPLGLELDPRGEILARFYSAEVNPKRVQRLRAEDLAVTGSFAEAEVGYLDALKLPVQSVDPVDPLGRRPDAPTDTEREDFRIRLSLVRLYIEQERFQEARAEIDAIDDELRRGDELMFRMEREAVRSRLDMALGNHAPAYRRLKRTLRQAAGDTAAYSWRSVLRRLRLNTDRAAVTESYALLAVAAYQIGQLDDSRWALAAARERGSDVTPLAYTLEDSP